jgi:hypothetical protein
MIAALIFVISIAAFLQFLVLYTQSLIAASLNQEIPDRVRQILGVRAESIEPAHFERLLQLSEICPCSRRDEIRLFAVRRYFAGLNFMLKLLPQLPTGSIDKVAEWLCRQRTYCTHYAAISLGERTRTLLSQGSAS